MRMEAHAPSRSLRCATRALMLVSLFDLTIPQAVMDGINSRFAKGGPSNDLAAAGVLIHQWDNTEDSNAMWMPCPATDWCGSFSDRWSTSLVNAMSPKRPADQTLVLFSYNTGGFILSPDANSVLCSSPLDLASSERICDPVGVSKDCIPGCFTKETNGTACWCDEQEPDKTCPNRNETTMPSSCVWQPDHLADMLKLQEVTLKGTTYNEVVIDAGMYTLKPDVALEAFFYIASDECFRNPACKDQTTAIHAQFLAKFGRTATETPLLVLNATNFTAPFTCDKC